MLVLPIAIAVMKTAPIQEPRRPQPTFFAEASGPVKWRTEKCEFAWANAALSKVFLDRYTLESVMYVNEGEVKAWRPDGAPYPDFEGFARLRLDSVEDVRIPFRYKKKNRFAVLNVPTSSFPEKNSISISLSFESNEIDTLYRLAHDSGKPNSRYQFIAITAKTADKFASIPVQIHMYSELGPLVPKIGTTFLYAGNRYKIAELRAFRPEDFGPPIPGDSKLPYRTTLVLQKMDGDSAASISGSVELPPEFDGKRYVHWRIDKNGNFARIDANDDTGNQSGFIEAFFSQGIRDVTGNTVVLVSKVNLKSIKEISLHTTASITAWLDNIPLDPKPSK